MWHSTTESPTNYPTISLTNIPTKITNIPTITPTNIPTITQIIEQNNNNQVVYKPRQFGHIILPVTLVVCIFTLLATYGIVVFSITTNK